LKILSILCLFFLFDNNYLIFQIFIEIFALKKVLLPSKQIKMLILILWAF
jgi:hypothetical protein